MHFTYQLASTTVMLFVAMFLLLRAHADQPVMRISQLLAYVFGGCLIPLVPVVLGAAGAFGLGQSINWPHSDYFVKAFALVGATIGVPVAIIYARSRRVRRAHAAD